MSITIHTGLFEVATNIDLLGAHEAAVYRQFSLAYSSRRLIVFACINLRSNTFGFFYENLDLSDLTDIKYN